MRPQRLAADAAALAANVLWLYGGVALAAAAVDDGASVSFGAVVAVVLLSFGLTRLLQRLEVADTTLRVWGSALSLLLLYLILRVEVVGDAYLWQLGWLRDLAVDPGETLAGRAGDVTAVILLSTAWLWMIARRMRPFTFETALAEASAGLVVVLIAGAFASAADAPEALRWLPAPFMVAALASLALLHIQPVAADRARPFWGAWLIWMAGPLAAIAGIALLVSLFDPASIAPVGGALAVALHAVGLGLSYALSPLFFVAAWTMEWLVDWIATDDEFIPEPADTRGTGQPEADGERTAWGRALVYAARAGLVFAVAAAVLVLLWLAFRRLKRRGDQDAAVREEIAEEEGGLGDLRRLLSGAFGRLRRPGAARGRDAIGRLYLAMLRRAAEVGLPRPDAATPLEFAPRLEAHFGSPLPGAISRAFAEARYGGRLPSSADVAQLRAGWEQLARG